MDQATGGYKWHMLEAGRHGQFPMDPSLRNKSIAQATVCTWLGCPIALLGFTECVPDQLRSG